MLFGIIHPIHRLFPVAMDQETGAIGHKRVDVQLDVLVHALFPRGCSDESHCAVVVRLPHRRGHNSHVHQLDSPTRRSFRYIIQSAKINGWPSIACFYVISQIGRNL